MPRMTVQNWYFDQIFGDVVLRGNVEGSPYFPDGEKIITSPVRSIDNLVVTTKSGSVYVLGMKISLADLKGV